MYLNTKVLNPLTKMFVNIISQVVFVKSFQIWSFHSNNTWWSYYKSSYSDTCFNRIAIVSHVVARTNGAQAWSTVTIRKLVHILHVQQVLEWVHAEKKWLQKGWMRLAKLKKQDKKGENSIHTMIVVSATQCFGKLNAIHWGFRLL